MNDSIKKAIDAAKQAASDVSDILESINDHEGETVAKLTHLMAEGQIAISQSGSPLQTILVGRFVARAVEYYAAAVDATDEDIDAAMNWSEKIIAITEKHRPDTPHH